MTWDDFCAAALPWTATITVEGRTGEGAYGPTYGLLTSVRSCYVDDKRRMVRAPGGSQVVSESTVYGPPELATAAPVGSRITLPSGRVTTVITVTVPSAAGMDLPKHAEIACE